MPANVGFCYLLISLFHPRYCYIGETESIATRIREHNSGHGAVSTNIQKLRPWYVALLILGFPGGPKDRSNRDGRKKFERKWHRLNSDGPHAAYTPQQAMRNGLMLCEHFRGARDQSGNLEYPELRPLRNLELEEPGNSL